MTSTNMYANVNCKVCGEKTLTDDNVTWDYYFDYDTSYSDSCEDYIRSKTHRHVACPPFKCKSCGDNRSWGFYRVYSDNSRKCATCVEQMHEIFCYVSIEYSSEYSEILRQLENGNVFKLPEKYEVVSDSNLSQQGLYFIATQLSDLQVRVDNEWRKNIIMEIKRLNNKQ